MNKLFKYFAFVIVVFCVLQCCHPVVVKFPNSLNKLEGKWQLENSNTFEFWKKQDSIFIGSVLKIENQDTSILENLRILNINNNIFYEASVISQNDGLPILFKLVSQENSTFSFENNKHDFPKNIIYNLQHKNLLAATISGNGKTKSFAYKKIK